VIPILQPEQHWVCPNCTFTDVTHEADPHTRFHTCGGLKGLTAPMLQEGTAGHVFAVEREDYVGRELVTYDGDDRPIMSVITTRDDGQDCAVMAPCARAGVSS
jgi:hypothetical protein